jgi:hypothetical protein
MPAIGNPHRVERCLNLRVNAQFIIMKPLITS